MEDIVQQVKEMSGSVFEKIMPICDMYVLAELKKQQLIREGAESLFIFLLEQEKQQLVDEIMCVLENTKLNVTEQ